MDHLSLSVIHWIINPILYFIIAYFVLGKPRYLSFHHVFIFSYILFIYLAALKVYSEDVDQVIFLYSVWLIPYIYLGSVSMIMALDGHDKFRALESFNKQTSSRTDRYFLSYMPIFSIATIILPAIYIFDKGFENVALFFLVSNPGSAKESMVLRIDSLNSNISPILTVIYSYSRSLFFPAYASILTIYLLNKKISKVHYFGVILSIMFFSFLSAAKAPLTIVFIAVLISLYLARRGKINKSVGTAIISLGFLIPSIIYPLMIGATGQDAANIALFRLWERLTWIPSYASALYFDAYGSLFPFAGFSSNRIFSSIFGLDYTSPSAILYDTYMKTTISGGLINASYFSSFYADWGLYGVFGGTILVASVSQSLQHFFDRTDKNAVTMGIRAVVLISISQLMLADFYSTALGRGMISLPIILAAFNLLTNATRTHQIKMPDADQYLATTEITKSKSPDGE